MKSSLYRILQHVDEVKKSRKWAMTILEVGGGERLDRFRVGDVLGQLSLRRHTLVRRARGGIDLPKNLSPGPCSARLQAESPPRALWRGSHRKNMRGDPV